MKNLILDNLLNSCCINCLNQVNYKLLYSFSLHPERSSQVQICDYCNRSNAKFINSKHKLTRIEIFQLIAQQRTVIRRQRPSNSMSSCFYLINANAIRLIKHKILMKRRRNTTNKFCEMNC